MLEVMAIVRPEKIGAVKKKLIEAGYPGYTCRRVRGRGRRRAVAQPPFSLTPKRWFSIVVPDEAVDAVVQGIMDACSEGKHGDGKIFVTPVTASYRMRIEPAEADAPNTGKEGA